MVVIFKDEFATRRDTVETSTDAFNYDVFLSFRGSDTRFGFTGNLYKALCDKEIRTFIDDEELQSGEEITPALMKAIQSSKIAIIVLSEDYAFSSFCLDELSIITNCMSKGMLVIPVFYKVDPSHVRHHIGSYGEAFAKHEKRFPQNKLRKWKEALRQVADLSGYHFKEGVTYEYKFIGSIVTSVSEKISRVMTSSRDVQIRNEVNKFDKKDHPLPKLQSREEFEKLKADRAWEEELNRAAIAAWLPIRGAGSRDRARDF